MPQKASKVQAELELVLLEALSHPIGLLMYSDDPQKYAQALYQARVKSSDPDLKRLQIRMVSFPDGNIAITKAAEPGRAPDHPPRPPRSQEELDEL